jgi:hypothetical protein
MLTRTAVKADTTGGCVNTGTLQGILNSLVRGQDYEFIPAIQ